VALVDVVVRTKNRTAFLARALDDVLAQTFTDWHLTVVNDGGDPGPVAGLVAERPRLKGRTTVLDLPESVGHPAAANKGFWAGSAEFVALHDDDDTWHSEFLARTVAHLRRTADTAVAVRTEIVWERQVGSQIVETGREVFHPLMQEPTYFDLIRFNHIVPISMLVRRSVLESIGGFDESIEMVEDWVFNLEIALHGGFGFIAGEPLAFWHQRPESQGDSGNSVISGHDGHVRSDRRVRDRLVREYVKQHGAGGLLYLAKYIDERNTEVLRHLDRIEARQDQIVAMLHARTVRGVAGRVRRRVRALRRR
jgi:glycosyltransferase involved in cell wall biosynthesis